jgi:alginate O-acetyltransferase complex protein AlgI
MIFSSIQYLLFLPIVVFLYWRTKGSVRLWLVVLSSLFFYMSWLPIYGLLLIALVTVNWILGLKIHDCFTRSGSTTSADELPVFKSDADKQRAKAYFGLGLLVNVGALCYYKYTNFLIDNIWSLTNLFREHVLSTPYVQMAPLSVPFANIALPLGISFFVFEFVHYLYDVFKGNAPIRSYGEFSAFAAFFPSQIAGPVKRYQDFNFRLRHPETWSSALAFEGGALIAQGLFKKVAIADPLGVAIVPTFAAGTVPGVDAVLAPFCFAIQLYCDFSGYTDIGRGSALLLGIRLPENFSLPYISKDLLDFWRRWHISLSTWLRDYVYIPLGGSKGGRWFGMRNTFITMAVCGLWHGAHWNYVLFGITHGAAMCVNRLWRDILKKHPVLAKATDNVVGTAVSVVLFWATYLFSLIIFRAPDLSHSGAMLSSLANGQQSALIEPLLRSGVFPITAVYLAFWGCTEFAARNKLPKFLVASENQHGLLFNPSIRFASWTAAVLLIAAARPSEAVPFVYFQF